jgi:hypothetical protein
MSEASITDRLIGQLDGDPDFEDEQPKPQEDIRPAEEDEEGEQDGLQEDEEEDEELSQEDEEEPGKKETEEVEEEEISVSTLSELADNIGADVADLYNLKIPVTKHDGTRTEVSIGEWKDSFREVEYARSEREQAEKQIESAKGTLAQKAQELESLFFQADAMSQAAEKQLMSDLAGVEQLQHTDPTQYVLKKQQLAEKQNELKQVREQAANSYIQQQQKLQQEQHAQRQVYVAEQQQKLTEFIPEWKDSKVMEKESAELSAYLIDSGVPSEEVNNIVDAKIVDIARKAMLWDRQSKAKPDAKKKVIRIGKKVLKSGKTKPKTTRKANQYSRDLKKARKALQGRDGEKAGASLFEKYFLEDM